MSPERYSQAVALFESARALPLPQREIALAAADPDVGAEARAMLAADSATGPLDHPSVLPGLVPPAPGELPSRIGPYTIVGRIGHGATGVVLEGRRDHPRRSAAIKMLRIGAAGDAVRRRFEHEADILASLSHPAIAQVFEGGVDDAGGIPLAWFALELVPGARPVTTHCREKALPQQDRLALFARICDAVECAHGARIIHRDLKPANILVNASGQPKVIDFGIARVLDPAVTMLTMQHGAPSVLGTAAYMSPEQWSGRSADVDARSDIYSLGVILYELLLDRPPFDLRGVPIHEAMQVVLTRPVPDPADAEARLRGDLSAIVLKAMARDRERRYARASDLAADIRSHLQGRPISARAPGLRQRVVGWIRSRPVTSAIAGSLAAAGIILGVTFVSAAILARRPARIVLHQDGQSARLQSMAGHTVHTWLDASDGISEAALADRPGELGGGQLAIITRSWTSNDPELAGHMAFYDPDRPDTPIWSTRDAPLTPPPGYEHRAEIRLDAGETILADFFEELPGEEVAVAQGLWPYSPVCIRIFDLSGRQLYQAWNDGGVLTMAWLPERRHLVFSGFSSEARWDDRGMTWRAGVAYPLIVTALEPRIGHEGAPWIVQRDQLQDPTTRWCKWLGPADRLADLGSLEFEVTSQWGQTDEELLIAIVRLRREGQRDAEIYFSLDQAGAEARRWTSDAYKAGLRAGELPDAAAFGLLDITALPPRMGAAASSGHRPAEGIAADPG